MGNNEQLSSGGDNDNDWEGQTNIQDGEQNI